GTAVCQKTDICKGHMWYAYEGEWMNWHKITTEQANEIIALNRKNQPVASLEEYASELIEDTKSEFENVVGQDSLTRFDSPRPNNRRKNNKRKKTTESVVTQESTPKQGNAPQQGAKNNTKRKKNNNRKPKPQD